MLATARLLLISPAATATGGSIARTTTANIVGNGFIAISGGSVARTTTANIIGLSGVIFSGTGSRFGVATIAGTGILGLSKTASLTSTATATGAGVIARFNTGSRTATATITGTGNVPSMSFVTRDPTTGNLMLDGQRFRFSGANAVGMGFSENPSMYGATVDADGLHLSSHSEVNAFLDSAEAMNATVIRVYGGVCSVGKTNSLQPTLGVFNAANLEPIDYALQQAALRGIRLYFPLVDAYQYYVGGAFWYCTVNGVTPDSGATQFYDISQTAILNSFKAHISYVLDHVNTYTGVAYKNDPTIFCWETGNELHKGSAWNDANVAWTDAVSRHIKVTKSAQQLVMDGVSFNTTGDEGGHLNIDLPYIDIMTFHSYSASGAPSVAANAAEAAHAHGKAWVSGEYTWNDKNASGASAGFTLDQWIAGTEASTFVDGDNYWQLLPPLVGVGGPSIFGLHYPGDDADMIARVNKLSAHALAMTNATVPAPVTFLTDNFTGTNGTALGSHTPDSGGTWSQQTGSSGVETIQNNRLYTTASFTNYSVYNATPPTANYDVTLTINIVSHVAGSVVWARGRTVSGVVTGYELNLTCNSSTAYVMGLKRWSAGSGSDLMTNVPLSVAPTVGSTHTLTLRMQGNQISGLWDGQVNIRVNNADLLAAGAAGLGANAVTSTTGMHIDSITATTSPAAETALPATFTPPRNEVVAVGDSTTDAWSANDYQPYLGSMYLNILHVNTMQRMKYGGVYATGGITATEIRDIHIPQVLALNPKPGACIVYAGTNDTGVVDRIWNLSYSAQVLRDICRALRNANIAPILTTIGPHDHFASYTPNSVDWNAYIRALADVNDIPLIDIWEAITDPDDTFKTGYSSDGLHPLPIAYEAMANRAEADGIPNIFPVNDPTLLTARTTAIFPNILNDGSINLGIFTTDTNADGVSDGFTTSGQTLSRTVASGWNPGDVMEFSARVQTLNLTSTAVSWTLTARCTVPGGFTYPDGTSGTTVEHGLISWTVDADGLMYVKFTVPTGTTAVEVRATLVSGTVTYSRVTPVGGDALAGSWQQLRNNANSATLRIGELTLRKFVAPDVITAVITGAGVVARTGAGTATTTATITGASTPPPFLSDVFTDTNGTLLESHTGAVGATWTKHTGWTGSLAIQSNRVYRNASTESHYYSSGVPSSANYDVTVTFNAVSNPAFAMAGAMGRMVVGTNTAYAAFVILISGTPQMRIVRWVSGTSGQLGSDVALTAPTVGTDHTITLRMVGSSISALYDGVLKVGPITDTNIAAAGRAGLIINDIGSSTTGWHIDSITGGV